MSRERLLPRVEILEKVARYEAYLQTGLYKAMHELEALQIRRLGAPLLWLVSVYRGRYLVRDQHFRSKLPNLHGLGALAVLPVHALGFGIEAAYRVRSFRQASKVSLLPPPDSSASTRRAKL
jgi:hypothetical protein